MAKLSKTWWGRKFIQALEGFTDSGRLSRGRAYSSDRRILKFEFKDALASATVRGNINHYFGVYKEPRYRTRIQMKPIPDQSWNKAIEHLGSRASLVSKLLMNEMPDNIEDVFAKLGLRLLPRSRQDFKQIECSCPDYANPCKHIAGLYYRLAAQLDQDPFLLFELRGLSREHLYEALSKSPLGEVLAAMLHEDSAELNAVESYYTEALIAEDSKEMDYQGFWRGKKRLPSEIEPAVPAAAPAIQVKKAGDFPPFWNKDASFIEVMEAFYERVRTKNKNVL
ncbi:MAG: hypothetical protein GY862_06580 [Gammaproteobacteria bacterium]|nr:hypothetical protein [Gammaproteobacteria bacterium]